LLTRRPSRTTKLAGAFGSVSFAGTSAVHPDKSFPLKSFVARAGVTVSAAWSGAVEAMTRSSRVVGRIFMSSLRR